MNMNSKLVNRKGYRPLAVGKNLTQNTSYLNKQTICSTSKSKSINDIIKKPISTEEYNRVLIQNQRLAKENAYLRPQLAEAKEFLRLSRNESIELKQQLSAAKTTIEGLKKELKNNRKPEISDQIKNVISLLMEDYLAIDSIKKEINQLRGRSQNVRGIMSSLQSLINTNNQLNESQDSEHNSERVDSYLSFNSSVRYSLSSQERDHKRRLSSERIRRDFNILSEMSTIFEMSTENRMSSLTSNEMNGSNNTKETVNAIHKEGDFDQNMVSIGNTLGKISTNGSNVIISNDKNSMKTIVNKELTFNQNIATTASNSMSSASTSSIGNNERPLKETKAAKTKRKTKKEINNETTTQKMSKDETKLKKKNGKTVKTQKKSGTKANDPMVYDFNDDDTNKENIMPTKLALRSSKRVRNKRLSLERMETSE